MISIRYSFIIPVYNRPDEVKELLESLTHQTVGGQLGTKEKLSLSGGKDFKSSEKVSLPDGESAKSNGKKSSQDEESAKSNGKKSLPRKMDDVEVVVVEDGSQNRCEDEVDQYRDKLNISYYYKDNSGPGQTRNVGAKRAKGEYLIFLDSDVVLPPGYLDALDKALARKPVDAFGGPDKANSSFTPVQKAISYAMTSFFTTGGIRGGKKKMDKFYPRSFNMGIKATVYEALGGFSRMRFGEDIDLSIRIFKGGYKCRLIPEAWVWHKRRTDFRKFWRQVFNSGIARINLYKKYPDSLKVVHLLPMVFTVGVIFLMILIIGGLAAFFFSPDHMTAAFGFACAEIGVAPLLLFSLMIFVDASARNKSAWIGLLSVRAAFTQLMGYGCGFLKAWWHRCVRGKGEIEAYKKTFYK